MIIGVAVKFRGDIEVRLPKPNRHVDCFVVAKKQAGLPFWECIGAHGQGFYTDTGEYLDREEAMTHVRNVGQRLLPDQRDGHINKGAYLTSEDVW